MSAITYKEFSYNGKDFKMPEFPKDEGLVIVPETMRIPGAERSPIIRRMNTVWDIERFKEPHRPTLVGGLNAEERRLFSTRSVAPDVLDMPIKFPGIAEYRVPAVFERFIPAIQRVADFEATVNPHAGDYWCYMTLRRGPVEPGTAQHEAPCHVDGFQGARWKPKKRINHTYTLTDRIPTTYYVQPFDFAGLDEAKHDFFWEMNWLVAQTDGAHAWRGEPYVIELMDAYCVHRGTESAHAAWRTWLRLSFEERVFDRLGNAHNPLFDYEWEMVPRDIEQLGLAAFRPDSDPTLRVFPWQSPDGTRNPAGVKTKPVLVRRK